MKTINKKFEKIIEIKNKNNKDDFSSKNFETAVAYFRAIDIMMENKNNNQDSYCYVSMMHDKHPVVDAYLIETVTNNIIGLQIKIKYYPNKLDNIEQGVKKVCVIPDRMEYLFTNPKCKEIRNGFSRYGTETVLEPINRVMGRIKTNLESYKLRFKDEKLFLDKCIDIIYNDTLNGISTNATIINQLQADILHKSEIEARAKSNLNKKETH